MSTALLTPAVLSASVRAAIDQAVAALPAQQRGQVSVGASLTGLEVSVASRRGAATFGGYAKKLWGGGYEAGARLQFGW